MSAIERRVEIVGEALSTLCRQDAETADRIPDLNRIIGLRNVLARGHAVVDDRVVWAAARDRIPELLGRIGRILEEPPAVE